MDSTVKKASRPRDPKTGRFLKKLHLVDLNPPNPEAVTQLRQEPTETLNRLELEQRKIEANWEKLLDGRLIRLRTPGTSPSLDLKVAIHMLARQGVEFYPFELRRIEREGLKPLHYYHTRSVDHRERELMESVANMQAIATQEAQTQAKAEWRRRLRLSRLGILLICGLVLFVVVTAATAAFSQDKTQMDRCQTLLVMHDMIRTLTDQSHLTSANTEAIDDTLSLAMNPAADSESLKDQLTLMTCEMILSQKIRTRKARG